MQMRFPLALFQRFRLNANPNEGGFGVMQSVAIKLTAPMCEAVPAPVVVPTKRAQTFPSKLNVSCVASRALNGTLLGPAQAGAQPAAAVSKTAGNALRKNDFFLVVMAISFLGW